MNNWMHQATLVLSFGANVLISGFTSWLGRLCCTIFNSSAASEALETTSSIVGTTLKKPYDISSYMTIYWYWFIKMQDFIRNCWINHLFISFLHHRGLLIQCIAVVHVVSFSDNFINCTKSYFRANARLGHIL